MQPASSTRWLIPSRHHNAATLRLVLQRFNFGWSVSQPKYSILYHPPSFPLSLLAASDSLLCSSWKLRCVCPFFSRFPFIAAFGFDASWQKKRFSCLCRKIGFFFHSTSKHRAMVKTTAQIVMRMNPPISISLRPRRSISRFFDRQTETGY